VNTSEFLLKYFGNSLAKFVIGTDAMSQAERSRLQKSLSLFFFHLKTVIMALHVQRGSQYPENLPGLTLICPDNKTTIPTQMVLAIGINSGQ
jgi:hypothetical protein